MTIVTAPSLSLLAQAVRRLDDPPRRPAWNHAEIADLLGPAPSRPAAVLVPLVQRDEGLAVILTRRTEQLRQHAGQISFPGGRTEPDDADAVAAALREAYEETGIRPEQVRPFGYLDCYETISNFCVTPVLGEVADDYQAQPDPAEVAEVFEVPLSFFLAAENKRVRRIHYRERARDVVEFRYGSHLIWGATAAMLVNLLTRLEQTVCVTPR